MTPTVIRPEISSTSSWWHGWPSVPPRSDPRWPFAALLTLYWVLGFSVFGFNRTPAQMLFIVLSGCLLDVVLSLVVRGGKIFPLSAWISCSSLAILLNYGKQSPILFLPVLLCIGGKHLLTLNGRHVFNPSMFGVAVSLLVGGEVITAAPAYQWAGSSNTITVFLIGAAMLLFLFRVKRHWIALSFIGFYVVNTAIRAVVMRHHLPAEMLFLGTFTTPPFFLFSLYMVTDPQTSPPAPRMQVFIAFCVATVDLLLHFKESVYTFFYAALIVASVRFVVGHTRKAMSLGVRRWAGEELDARRARAAIAIVVVSTLYGGVVYALTDHHAGHGARGFAFVKHDNASAGLDVKTGTTLQEVDPRVQHIAKWVLSVGDSVGAGDFDDDGDVDLFFAHPLMRAEDRAGLYRNDGSFHFTRVPVPAIDDVLRDPRSHGLISGATFADVDGDGDLDLALAVGFGRSLLLQNRLHEDGKAGFVDVSVHAGLVDHSVSLAITFLDFDGDGDLDLLELNALAPLLPDYDAPTPLNLFALPPPAYDGDRRALHFMHDGWHNANNGGGQTLYRNRGDGTFEKLDGASVGLTSTRWSLAVAVTDFNGDHRPDLYVANDFGPDDVYLNRDGVRFEAVRGSMFNDVGHDTYKGMNATAADFDGDGHFDVAVSNVHHSLQAEGSMLWMSRANADDAFVPRFVDEASSRGMLNEHRFGWGAAAGDLDNDGWPDLVQANGMVDDRLDRALPDGVNKDFWYVNHKLMQSGPSMHTYADMWGDIRGRVIYPNEARRAYLNLGDEEPGHFVDVAHELGLADPDNSRGVLLCDLDDDGDLDAVITNQHAPPSLYENRLRQMSPDNSHYVQLDLRDGGVGNRMRIGARVTLRFVDDRGQSRTQTQEVRSLGGFEAQQCPVLHFGLGRAHGPVDVSIEDGHAPIVQLRGLAADRRHLLRAPTTTPPTP